MNVVEQVTSYNALITKSFENAMGTMERVHQKSMDMAVELLKELGVPEGPADNYADKHRRMLHTVYSSVVSVNEEFGEMIVEQVDNVNTFLSGVTDAIVHDIASVAKDPSEAHATPRSKPINIVK